MLITRLKAVLGRIALGAALLAGSGAVMTLAAPPDEARAYETVSSYYGYELAGYPTASGEPFAPDGYTAAHKTLPLGTVLLVTRTDYYGYTRSVEVVVNDRGPYVEGRELDLSRGAAIAIGLDAPGVGVVDMQVLSYPYYGGSSSYAI